MSKDHTRVLIRLPTDLYKKIGHLAVETNVSRTALIIEALTARFGNLTEEKEPTIKRKRISKNGNSKDQGSEQESSNEESAARPKTRRKRKSSR